MVGEEFMVPSYSTVAEKALGACPPDDCHRVGRVDTGAGAARGVGVDADLKSRSCVYLRRSRYASEHQKRESEQRRSRGVPPYHP
jgi:hypothetical protein